MADTVDVAELVNQMPELDPARDEKDKAGKPRKSRTDEFKLTGPKWAVAEGIYDRILAGGREAMLSLVGMISDGTDPAKYKPRYVLHGLALYLCRPEKQAQRSMLVETLASQLGTDRPKYVQGFLVRELEVVGTKDAVGAVGKLLLDEEIGDDAIRTITSLGQGAAEQFRAALPQAQGKRRMALIKALAVLADAQSVAAMKEAAVAEDTDTRLAAVFGLARAGDASCIDLLLKASEAEGWARMQATKACLVAAERFRAAGNKADSDRIYRHLRDTRTDASERYIRDIAERALSQA